MNCRWAEEVTNQLDTLKDCAPTPKKEDSDKDKYVSFGQSRAGLLKNDFWYDMYWHVEYHYPIHIADMGFYYIKH